MKTVTCILICASFLASHCLLAQDEEWINDETYEAPGVRDAVPELPPLPDVRTPVPKFPWTSRHADMAFHPPMEELPAPKLSSKDVVTEDNPLKLDVFITMRSPYSYLVLQRVAYLQSQYNVDITVKAVFPNAVRSQGEGESGKSTVLGRWYYGGYSVIDQPRTALYQGLPFRYANPDPIFQDTQPHETATNVVAPMEQQPYIGWLTRLATAAQLEGKSLEYAHAVMPLIWGAAAPLGEWPLHVEEAVNSIGMDYDAVIADIRKNPEKYDAVWAKNQEEHHAAGQGGVPCMTFNGEPFFGQDRFDQFFWRLQQNGLTKRTFPREPMVTKPLRWPGTD